MTIPPSITVTRNTTLTQLQEFTEGLKDTKRLRGKQNEDGSITLYAKDTKRGLGSKLFGHSEKSVRKHEMAREAVKTVINNTERSMSLQSVDRGSLENVRLALGKTTDGELKVSGLKVLTSVMSNKVYQDQGIVGGPGLGGLGTERTARVVEWATNEIKNLVRTDGDPEARKEAFKTNLGERLTGLFETVTSQKKRENLALSNGSVLKNELRNEIETLLRKELGPDHPALTDEAFLEDLLDGAFKQCARQLLPNRENDDGSTTIGDHTYTKDKHLGEGGHGTVDRYFCQETGKYIVLKTAIAGDPEAMQLFARELRTHRSVTGQENIVGLLGPVRMTGDTVGIALEYAPYGDFNDVMGKINDPNNGVGPESTRMMRLTMLHDVAQGLGHMQSRKSGEGVLHLDFGSRNMFIGERGVSKIGDFGLSTKTSKFDVETTERAKNTYMVAPEVTISLKENLETRTPITSSKSEGYQSTLGQVQEQFGRLDEAKQKNLCGNVRENVAYGVTREREFDAKKAEVWSLGVIAFEMMTGRLPVPEQEGRDVTTETEDKYRDFGSDFRNRALNSYGEDGKLVPGFFGETTGDLDVDDLINQLMHPDPSQRPSPEQLLNHSAFRPEVFDSVVGHQLVEQLVGGN